MKIQVHLQTQQEGKISAVRLTVDIVKRQGILALYNGLSASLLRQLTYSTARFGIYEVNFPCLFTVAFVYTVFILQVSKQYAGGSNADSIPFYQKALIAGMSGAFGGFVGTPGDMINVRMQNDIKIPAEQRRKLVA